MKLYRFLSSLGFCLLVASMAHARQGQPARGVGVYQPITGIEKELAQQQYWQEVDRLAEERKFDASLDDALSKPTKWAEDFVVVFAQPHLHTRDYSLEQRKIDEASIAQALRDLNRAVSSEAALDKNNIKTIVDNLKGKGVSQRLVRNFNALVAAPIRQLIDEAVASGEVLKKEHVTALEKKASAQKDILKTLAEAAAEKVKQAQEKEALRVERLRDASRRLREESIDATKAGLVVTEQAIAEKARLAAEKARLEAEAAAAEAELSKQLSDLLVSETEVKRLAAEEEAATKKSAEEEATLSAQLSNLLISEAEAKRLAAEEERIAKEAAEAAEKIRKEPEAQGAKPEEATPSSVSDIKPAEEDVD